METLYKLKFLSKFRCGILIFLNQTFKYSGKELKAHLQKDLKNLDQLNFFEIFIYFWLDRYSPFFILFL